MHTHSLTHTPTPPPTHTHTHTHTNTSWAQTLRYAQEEDDHLTVQAGIVKENSELQKYRYKDPDARTESINDT